MKKRFSGLNLPSATRLVTEALGDVGPMTLDEIIELYSHKITPEHAFRRAEQARKGEGGNLETRVRSGRRCLIREALWALKHDGSLSCGKDGKYTPTPRLLYRAPECFCNLIKDAKLQAVAVKCAALIADDNRHNQGHRAVLRIIMIEDGLDVKEKP